MLHYAHTLTRTGAAMLAAYFLAACAGQSDVIVQSAPPMAAADEAPIDRGTAIRTLCEPDETVAFSGDVQDDFGLTISVCLQPASAEDEAIISIRSSGEGGGNVLSCKASECDGIIGLQHYRRPRFTILTLEWEQDGSRQKLVESHSAEVANAQPQHSVSHSWSSVEELARGIEPIAYPVAPASPALSLLAVGEIIAAKDWPEPALTPVGAASRTRDHP